MISATKEPAPNNSCTASGAGGGGRQLTHSLEGIRKLLLGQFDIGNHNGVWVGASLAVVNPADCDRARVEELSKFISLHLTTSPSLIFFAMSIHLILQFFHSLIPFCPILYSAYQFVLHWLSLDAPPPNWQ